MTLARLLDTGRALTIRRPWIAAQLLHGRPIEVRSRPAPSAFIGRRVWLHCAKTVDAADQADEQLLAEVGFDTGAAAAWPGHIVGRATILSSSAVSRGRPPPGSSWGRWFTDLWPERCNLEISIVWHMEVERVRPVGPLRGQLGLWTVDAAAHRMALAGVVAHRRMVIEEMLEPATWEIGELRVQGTALELGRAGDRRLRVDPSRLDLEVDSRGRLTRHWDIRDFDELRGRVARVLEGWGCSKPGNERRGDGQLARVRP